ncbi:GM18733 [Drosophila sechellia]|uniref:GM18733 n=1 Tax=Drosophila sechellia TaxID=7238 RepID=B4IMW7_DROSE|nr:GM18733 [Drosophila sechellia]
MLEPPKFIENDCYNGSRTFTWLADMVGLSVDLVSLHKTSTPWFLRPLLPYRYLSKRVCARVRVYTRVVCQSYGIKAAEQISLSLRTMHFLKDRAGISFREICKTYLATGGK